MRYLVMFFKLGPVWELLRKLLISSLLGSVYSSFFRLSCFLCIDLIVRIDQKYNGRS
jgi:hypothetical protein